MNMPCASLGFLSNMKANKKGVEQIVPNITCKGSLGPKTPFMFESMNPLTTNTAMFTKKKIRVTWPSIEPIDFQREGV